MKATLENLKWAMAQCAQAHGAEFCDWSDEDQLGIHKTGVPLYADVRSICRAFFEGEAEVEEDWGYTTVWLYAPFRENVDLPVLRMALPAGTQIKED